MFSQLAIQLRPVHVYSTAMRPNNNKWSKHFDKRPHRTKGVSPEVKFGMEHWIEGVLEQTQGLHLQAKFHLNVFIVSASGALLPSPPSLPSSSLPPVALLPFPKVDTAFFDHTTYPLFSQ